jgi:hypothetical protein
MGMFANAKVIEAKKPAKGKKDETFVPVKGLHVFAALQAVKKNVEAQIAVFEAGIKSTMLDRFIDEGMKFCKKPENFKGEENGSTASLQFRCRSSASGLSEEEIALLEEHNIPLEENVARDETFVINPAYADLSDEKNADMLAKVEEALSSLGLPADFILKQEKVSKVVATEKSINAVCSIKDKETVAALLPLVYTPAIRASLAEDANPFEVVEAALNPVEG